jgi:eukaryotic-like serine/threonine-protein kinase
VTVDKRADIWAFGVVLFEMLTGRRLFQGETTSDILASVLKTDPDWSVLPAETPPRVRELLRRCLTGDPRERLRDIGEARLELARAPSASAMVDASSPQGVSWLVIASAVAAALILGFAARSILGGSTPTAPLAAAEVRFTLSLPDGVALRAGPIPAVSPDGSVIAFVASTVGQPARIWIRRLGESTPAELPGTDDAISLFWSPDGVLIGFLTLGRELKKVPAAGGPIETLCSVPDLFPDGAAGTWGRDGTILFSANLAGGLRRVSANGGVPVPVTEPDRSQREVGHAWPRFFSNGRQLVYTAVLDGSSPRLVYVGSLEGGERKRLLEARSKVVYAEGVGQLLFVRGDSLLTQGFDEDKLEMTGTPVTVCDGVVNASGSLAGFDEAGGTLVCTDNRRDTTLEWFDRTGKRIDAVPFGGNFRSPVIASDDRRIAIDRANTETGAREIWVLDGDRSTRLTFGATDDSDVVGARRPAGCIRWGHGPVSRGDRIWAASGRRTLHQFGGGSDEVYPNDWSEDGRFIAYNSYGQGNAADIYVLPLEAGAKPLVVASTRYNEHQARFAPGSRFIAYASDESGRPEVWVQAMPPAAGRWPVSAAGGAQPMWRADGRELFFLALDGTLMAVPVRTGTTLDVGTPAPLFRVHVEESVFTDVRNHYAVTSDGQRFLVNRVTGGSRLQVVTNWRGRGTR